MGTVDIEVRLLEEINLIDILIAQIYKKPFLRKKTAFRFPYAVF